MKKETLSILKMRAALMASESAVKHDSSSVFEIIEFKLSSENYGIESAFVREVYPLKDFAPLPGVPQYILGIVNVRGHILAVIDLKKFFSLPEKGLGELNKVIIIQNENMEFGILADEIVGIKSIYLEDLLPVPTIISSIGKKYLKGLTRDSLIILSADNLLSDKSIIVNEVVT
jgi:purine-binding chemotaxis protein CheW